MANMTESLRISNLASTLFTLMWPDIIVSNVFHAHDFKMVTGTETDSVLYFASTGSR